MGMRSKAIGGSVELQLQFDRLVELMQVIESIMVDLHGVYDQEKIFYVVEKKLRGYSEQRLNISLLNSAGQLLLLRSAIAPGLINQLAKAAGLSAKKYDLLQAGIYRQAVSSGKTICAPAMRISQELFPAPIAAMVNHVLKIAPTDQSVVVPIKKMDKVIGVLDTTAKGLTEKFIPSIELLADLISTNLDRGIEHTAFMRQSELLQTFLDNSPVINFVIDRSGLFDMSKGSALGLLGLQNDQAVEAQLNAYTVYADNSDIIIGMNDAFAGKISRVELLQQEHWFAASFSPFMHDANGRVSKIQGYAVDITEQRKIMDALEETSWLLAESQAVAGLGSYVLGIATDHWEGSPVLDRIFGISAEADHSIAGWLQLVHPDDHAAMADYFNNEVIGQEKPFDKQYRIVRHSDGVVRWVHGLGKLEFDTEHRPIRMIGTIKDITDLKMAEMQQQILDAKLHKLATTDALTSLPNQYALFVELAARIEQAKEPFYLLQLNITNYAAVVSFFGNMVADDYLRQLSMQVRQSVIATVPGSFVSRPTGAAGFDIIVNTNDQAEIAELSRLLLGLFMHFTTIGAAQVSTAVCMGACSSLYGQTAEELMQKTLLALQNAKKLQTNTVQLYDVAMTVQQQHDWQMSDTVALALQREEIVPYFQPQVTMLGRIVGYELLARWIMADGTVHSPWVFLDHLARMNLLEALFESMLRQACVHMERLVDRDLVFSINVSPAQFLDPTFVDKTVKIIQRYGVDPKRIKLEILETVLAQEAAVDTLRKLGSLGFKFAIDDFGQGYNNLLQVSLLVEEGVIDTIKIAREVVTRLIANDQPNKYEVVSSIIAMARKWNVAIVVEGLETAAEYAVLQDICVEFGQGVADIAVQGYYFSKPFNFDTLAALPADAFYAKAAESKRSS